ncbi:unnamed protein product [Sphagnum jensenii]|uniref:Uncharacterized protein n=1 Tax=Sphagnum jensenii TaxID=128206 RepID=A0ABP0V9K6_9BRYO
MPMQKLREAKALIKASGYDIRLEVDGGVGVVNIKEVAEAGADMFGTMKDDSSSQNKKNRKGLSEATKNYLNSVHKDGRTAQISSAERWRTWRGVLRAGYGVPPPIVLRWTDGLMPDCIILPAAVSDFILPHDRDRVNLAVDDSSSPKGVQGLV